MHKDSRQLARIGGPEGSRLLPSPFKIEHTRTALDSPVSAADCETSIFNERPTIPRRDGRLAANRLEAWYRSRFEDDARAKVEAIVMSSLLIRAAGWLLILNVAAGASFMPEATPPPEPPGSQQGASHSPLSRPSKDKPSLRRLVLDAEVYRHYVDAFNKNDNELYKGAVPNSLAWEFLEENIPLLDCPDEDVERTYYFRWWTYRKHLKKTPVGFIVDEFLPNVGWAGAFNSISCAAGHHIYEGRWLSDSRYLDDYIAFWFGEGGNPRGYSFWAADSVWQRYCVSGDSKEPVRLLAALIANFEAWEKSNRDANGLYWQIDDRDGMEVSIGGSGYRATINSYQYGDALAISRIAELACKPDLAQVFRDKAAAIKKVVQERLWDSDAKFFKVLPRGKDASLADVRELHGYTPWYFNLPDPQFARAWKQAVDPQGFFAPYGLTSAERRHPKFALSYMGHECQWNGPVWPYATSITLTGLANLLNGPRQDAISAKEYFELLKIYAKSHKLVLDDGRVVPWIDENQNPDNGDWISRTRLKTWKNGAWDSEKGGVERGKDYNHSTFCDLVISGLIGLRPRRRHRRGEPSHPGFVGVLLSRRRRLSRAKPDDPFR